MTSHPVLTDRRHAMGGETVITVVGGSQELLDDAFQLALQCEQAWSRFIDDSELSRLNNAGGHPVEVSPLTVALVAEMLDGFSLTHGDFNPTVLPAVIAAGYTSSLVHDDRVTHVPSTARVFESLDDVVITEESVRIPARMTLDSGGIGKGFAADIIAAAVMASGARGVMVSMSGDVVVVGAAPQPGGWLIGVEDPFDESAHVEVKRLIEGAVVTSSQRKKRFADAHHLINPRTGASAVTGVQTVSVIASTGARAEVLAKCGFLRPTQEFLEWLPSVGAAGMVIDHDSVRLETSNWGSYS